MINLILPVVEEPEKLAEFAKKAAKSDVKVFVGVRKGLNFDLGKKSRSKKAEKANIEVHTFAENANAEEIINALHSAKMEKGKILICRRPLTEEEFSKLTTSQKDVATLKAKHSKFSTALKNFAKKIVKRFFAFTYFEDISAICFGENMFELMTTIQNLSMASRINRYVGVDIEEVETAEKQVKKQYSRTKNILSFLLWTLLLLGSIAGGVLTCIFAPLHALIVILVIFWILLALFLWFVGFVNFTRTLAVGKLHFGRAEEVAMA